MRGQYGKNEATCMFTFKKQLIQKIMKYIKLAIFLVIIPFNLIADINLISKEQSKAIDTIFSEWDKQNTPGCGLGVIKDGKLIYARGYGAANLEHDIPNSSTSVFRIGSTSKQFTAATIILLSENNKLSLDDSLDKFFPAFPNYAKSISIRHLLNHTSGIRDYLTLADLKGFQEDEYYTDKDVMAWLVNQTELNFAPGEEFVYSNSGYWLLGQIVKQVAQMSLADYAMKNIFKPLGMSQTRFHNDHTKIVKNRASGYMPKNKDEFQISMTTLDIIGDGGIFTSIEDIKKWDDAYYGSKVLSKTFWEMMTQQGKLNNKEELDYAAGLFISEYNGLKTISHGGAFVGFRAELLRFPNQQYSVAVFTNRGDANPTSMAYKVADVFLSDEYVFEEKQESISREEPMYEVEKFSFEQLIGTYELKAGLDIVVSVAEEKLHAKQLWNNSEYDLINLSNNTYYIVDATEIKFIFSDLKDNLTQNATIDQAGRISESKRKVKLDLSGVELEDYIGDFYSKELDVTYEIYLEDGLIKTKIRNNAPLELTLSKKDLLLYQGTLLKFIRNNGEINEFIIDAGRVKNLKFSKVVH
jgi:CubicO group peptidase (beta-lactamase class C family)